VPAICFTIAPSRIAEITIVLKQRSLRVAISGKKRDKLAIKDALAVLELWLWKV